MRSEDRGGKGQQAGSHVILPGAANTGTCLSVDAQLMLCSGTTGCVGVKEQATEGRIINS